MDKDDNIEPPGAGGVGLLIIDMINDLAFPGAERLRQACEDMADKLVAFREKASAAGVPTIYVNDNFGHWRQGRAEIVAYAARQDSPGRHIVEKLRPRPRDYFVVKPRFSGFYATNLQVLLPKLKIDRLILTGVATDICVLFTAADAYMREYRLWVPEDLVASDDPQRDAWALEIMRNSMNACTQAASNTDLRRWMASAHPSLDNVSQ